MLTNLPSLDQKPRSITQSLSPTYRKIYGAIGLKKQSQKEVIPKISIESIRSEYQIVTTTIDNLEQLLNKRMQIHEQQLISVLKIEMDKMIQNIKDIVTNYNTMIREKNLSQDLWETRNQIQYFKFEARKLFEENKQLKDQVLSLKKQIEMMTFEQQCKNSALRNITKKLLKAKVLKNVTESSKDLVIKDGYQNRQVNQTRKRHQSLLSSLRKQVKNQEQFGNEDMNKTNNLSTMAKQKYESKTKTEADLTKQFLSSPQLVQKAERRVFLNGQGRSQRIKFLKQKLSICRSIRDDYTKQESSTFVYKI